ncbi:SRPBCC family protein [Mycolicibacterium sp. 3033]|nr:SRPBCC family protein [Mycolicibacterium aurantiacum]
MTHRMVPMLATAGLLYAARRYFRDWGTTKEEAQDILAGDELVRPPMLRTTEAVSIDAPAEQVWPWLVQMGQDRGGLYGFGVIEKLLGLQYRNADQIHPEWQHIAADDEIRLVPRRWMNLRDGVTARVVTVVDGRTIVLRIDALRSVWDVVWSFHLVPRGDARCRLLFRSRLALRHPGEVVIAELMGPARALLTRGMLVGVKRRVEARRQAEAAAEAASAGLHRIG